MSIEQRLVGIVVPNAGSEEDINVLLNDEARNGWKLQYITQIVTFKAGRFSGSGYYDDDLQLLFERSTERYSYKCSMKLFNCGMYPRKEMLDEDLKLQNMDIANNNKEGYRLAHILQLSKISADPEHPARGTGLHFYIYEKKEDNSGTELSAEKETSQQTTEEN